PRIPANVEHQRKVAARVEQGGAACDGELCLRLAADHLDIKARLLARAMEKLARIGGAAAGLSGNHSGALDAQAAHFAGADLERVDGARDRILREAAAGGEPLT